MKYYKKDSKAIFGIAYFCQLHSKLCDTYKGSEIIYAEKLRPGAVHLFVHSAKVKQVFSMYKTLVSAGDEANE